MKASDILRPTTQSLELPLDTNPLVAEIYLAAVAQKEGNLDTMLPYMRRHEYTALMEAVNPEHYSTYHLTYDAQQGRFIVEGLGSAYGLFDRGVEAIEQKMNKETDGLRKEVWKNEYERRLYERAEQDSLDMLAAQDGFSHTSLVTISPFPEEVHALDPHSVAELGYRADRRVWKIRTHQYNPLASQLQTTEYVARGSNIARIQAFAQRVFGIDLSGKNTTEIVGTPIPVDPQQMPQLEAAIEQELYAHDDEAAYRYQLVSEHAQNSINDLVSLDVALGRALREGRLNEEQVARRKQKALVTAYSRVALRTGLGEWASTMPEDVREHLAQATDEELEGYLGGVSFAVCGMNVSWDSPQAGSPREAGSPYSNPEAWIAHLFNAKGKRVVNCPECPRKVIIDGAKLTRTEKIRCPCGCATSCGRAIFERGRPLTALDHLMDPAPVEVIYGE